MGFKSRNIFGAQLNRNFKAGSKIADNVTKSLLLGGLVGADYIYRKSKQPRSQYRPLTTRELQEIEELEQTLATPFKFTNAIIGQLIASLFALGFPILGAYLYCYEDWWMFFSVLICGMIELCLLVPSSMLIEDKINSQWIFSTTNKDEQIKQIKILLWLSIITNAILIVLNSYPFIVYYEGGILVTLMTMCLYFANGGCIYISTKELRNINVRFEQNVNKFNRAHNTKNVHNETEQPIEQPNDSSAILNNSIEQIQAYIDRCNSEQISLEVIKANIRILNTMTDSYKRGYSRPTNRILEQLLKEKINSAKRDFVKRECRLALDILNMLKIQSIDDVIASLKQRYQL